MIILSFFAPFGKYPACGMFSLTHIICLIICLILIGIALFLSLKYLRNKVKLITFVIAITISILELIKIIFNFYYGYTGLNNWLPLAFCSLFIYACWFAISKNKVLQKLGQAFIVDGGLISGLSFLIMPTTSITMYPMWHFCSFYSMLYHSLMFYLGLLYLINNVFRPYFKTYYYYILFTLPFMIMAIVINSLNDVNLMFLRDPYRVPVPFLHQLAAFNQPLYIITIMLGYWILPYGLTCLIDLLINRKKVK